MVKVKHHEEIHKFLFGSVALLFLIAFVSVMTYQQSAITGNVVFEKGITTQNIAFVKDTQIPMGIRNIPSLYLANINVQGIIKDGSITFQEKSLAFDGSKISEFSVSSTHQSNIPSIDLTFRVQIEHQQKAGIFKENTTLYTHQGIEIPTIYVKSDERFHFYTATITSFESYVLGLKEKKTTPNEVELPQDSQQEGHEEVEIVPQEILTEPAPIQSAKKNGFFKQFFNWFK
jgi:hypothetical protein